jgi:hypothetical protein
MIEAFEQLEINPPTPWYKKISVPMYVIIFLGILVVQIVVLYAMGRQFICNCGVIKFWEGDVMSSSNSQQIADWYTFSHIIHGFVFYGFFVWVSRRFFKKIGGLPLGLIFIGAVLLETGWEILENSTWIIEYYRNNTVSLGYIGDSILNSVFDVIWMSIGFVMAKKFPVWAIILLAVLFEIMTGYFVRDGLFLNILMFIYPSEAIKAWQVAI